MARISDPTRTQAPSQSPDTSSPRAPGRFRRFPWWVFLPVGLCLCGSVAAYIWLSADIQQQQQAAAAARATANAVPTQFDHPPGFGIITNTPEPPYSPAATPTRWPTDTPYVDYFIPAIETANAAWMLASYATETAIAAAPTVTDTDYTASASVSPQKPTTPGGSVTITGKLLKGGRPLQGATMIVTLYCEGFNGEATYTGGPKTNIDGTALQIANIGYAVAGSIVVVDIAFYVNGRLAARATTSFTPQLAGLVGIIGNDNPG